MCVVYTCHTTTTPSVAIIELSLEHRLHFCQLYQRVKSFVVLTGIICEHARVTSIAHNLIVVSEDTIGRLSSLHEATLDSYVIDVIHLFNLVPAMVMMRRVMSTTKGNLGALNILIV